MNTTARKHFLVSIFFILVALVFLLTSCNSGNVPAKPTKYKRDTSTALILHLGYGFKSIQYGPAKRVTLDTLIWVGKDSSTMKREMGRTTYYLVNMQVQTDSTIAKAYNIPEFDSTGKRYYVTISDVIVSPQYARDSVTNFDSAANYLKQFIIKPDTLKR